MPSTTRNVLVAGTARKSKKPLIITGATCSVIFITLMVYFTYLYNYYCKIKAISKFSIETVIKVAELLGTFPPLDVEVLKLSVIMQVTDLWLVYLVVIATVFIVTTTPKNEYKNMEHGYAEWADERQIKEFSKDTTGIPCAKDFYVPLDGGGVVANLNEIVIGGSGAGKSFRKIEPDIIQMFGSYVVTDPKGELFRNTYKLLKENGYVIKVLNLIDIRLGNTYNPFAYMTSEQDVVSICSLFMKNTAGEGEKEDFWTGAALKLLTAISVYLFKSDKEIKSFGRVIRLANSIRYKQGEIDQSCELARKMNEHSTKYPFDAASVTWNGMLGNPQETMASIVETLTTRLRLWSVSDVDLLTSDDEMEFDLIGDRKTVIFLITPAARNPYKAVANIFYSQLFERLMRVGDDKKHNGRFDIPISFELDEFANIGEIPAFQETLAVIRSYNIRTCIVLQGLSQLKAVYKDTWESIIGNCDIFTFLGSKDNDTLEYISKKLGDITVQTDSRSRNRGGNTGGGTDTENIASRPLLKPNEIKKAIKPRGVNRKYGGACIIWLGYEDPFYLPKFDTLNHPMISKCGSSFKKDRHNNTDIEKIYLPLYASKKEAHDKLLQQKRAELEQEENQIAEQQKKEYEENQEKLREQFEAEIEKQIQLPLSDKQEEERPDAEFDEESNYMFDGETYQTLDEYEDDVSNSEMNPVLIRIKQRQIQNEEIGGNTHAEEALAELEQSFDENFSDSIEELMPDDEYEE